MKRLIASRRLKRKCIHCDSQFIKGNVYYLERKVFEEDGEIYASEYLCCSRCNFEHVDRKRRFEEFKVRCHHPEAMLDEIWSYIPGEAVMQPDHIECLICGEWL